MKRTRRQGEDLPKRYNRTQRISDKVTKREWDKKYVRMAFEVALLGATEKDLAHVFGVSENTIRYWKKEIPAFGDALKKGMERADAKIARSLYHRAKGYSHPDVHITSYQGVVTVTDITKHYPPDVGAIKFWLTNRQKDKWSDTSKVETNTNVNFHSDIKLSDISTEELKMAEKLAMRNLLQKMKN
jgi:uncharacterized protein YjcR